MKKIFALICLMVATVTTYGQSTPEAIIGQCPALPSPRDLATGKTEAFTVWRAQIGREQGLYKELLPEAQHADALLKESNAAQHPDVLNRQRGKAASDIAMKTSIEGVMPAMVAGRYLTISGSVTEY